MGLGTMWGRQLAEKMLNDAGFKSVRVEQLAHDFQNEYYIIRHAACSSPEATAAGRLFL